MNSSSTINISAEHWHQVFAFLIAIILFSALFALDKYLSEQSRQFRQLRRLLAKAKLAVQHENVSAETRSMLQVAQQDFYRASKLMVIKPARPATLRQTMELCQQQCEYVLTQASNEQAAPEKPCLKASRNKRNNRIYWQSRH